MSLPATAFWAALFAPLLIWLSVRCIQARLATQVALGAPNRRLERATRAQANFVEYVPLTLLMLALAEGLGLAGWGVHTLAAVLFAARCSHAYGISQEPEVLRWRSAGMVGTFTVLAVLSVTLLALLGLRG